MRKMLVRGSLVSAERCVEEKYLVHPPPVEVVEEVLWLLQRVLDRLKRGLTKLVVDAVFRSWNSGSRKEINDTFELLLVRLYQKFCVYIVLFSLCFSPSLLTLLRVAYSSNLIFITPD